MSSAAATQSGTKPAQKWYPVEDDPQPKKVSDLPVSHFPFELPMNSGAVDRFVKDYGHARSWIMQQSWQRNRLHRSMGAHIEAPPDTN